MRWIQHALFFIHLSLEKLLKGKILEKINEPAPPIHQLRRLAETLGITLDDSLKIQLDEISSFNISARYDDYKEEFRFKATEKYSTEWFANAKKLIDFIKNL
jgi:HEPN domain-containing protein